MNVSFSPVRVRFAVAILVGTLSSIGPCAAAESPTTAATGVAIEGNHPSVAEPDVDGEAAADRGLDITVFLAPRNQVELHRLLAAQQDPSSPDYHHWLTPKEYATRFGPREADLRAVARWLTAQGFEVVRAEPSEAFVRARGSVGQAKRTFGVKILLTRDGRHFFNTADPVVPAQFAGIISHIHGLDNMQAETPLIHKAPPHSGAKSSRANPANPELLRLAAFPYTGIGTAAMPVASPQFEEGGIVAFGVHDLYVFYDEASLASAGIGGGNGDCIALIEDSNYLSSAVDLFDSTFSLPAINAANVFPSTDPGINGDEEEALLDIEWAHAVAPEAPIEVYIGNPHNNVTGDPLLDAIVTAINDNSCGAINISFGFCGARRSFYKGTLDPLFAQAALQGQSVFVATGDRGAAGLVLDKAKHACVAGRSRNVSEMSADPNVTAVGGTEFMPNYDANGNDVGSVPENAWNDSSRQVAGASGGGASAIFPKPSWQKSSTPGDRKRDVPDVAMVASWYFPGAWVGDDQPGGPQMSCCVGGTSLSTVIWAGIAKLISSYGIKSKGLSAFEARLGNINPKLYQLASSAFKSAGSSGLASVGLRDVTMGVNNWAPTGVKGFAAGPGYDKASGWGTADIATFVTSFADLAFASFAPGAGGGALTLNSGELNAIRIDVIPKRIESNAPAL